MHRMPQALNRLKAEVAGSSGQVKPARPQLLSVALRPPMKRLKPELSRKPANAGSLM